MVLMGVTKKLNILFDSGGNLELKLDEKVTAGSKAIVDQKSGKIIFVLSTNQLEYLCAFLLRAYRDNTAEVNHIHIEGEKSGEAFDLTLFFSDFVDPLTPEEAFKLMK